MITRHRLPAAVFAGLAAGGGGPQAVEHLRAARRSRTLLLITKLVRESQSDAVTQAFAVLKQVHNHDADAVTRVLDHPAVGAAAIARRDTDWLGRAALAAAIHARADVEVPVMSSTDLYLPTLGMATIPGDGPIEVRCSADHTVLLRQENRAVVPRNAHEHGDFWQPTPIVETQGGKQFALDGALAGMLSPAPALARPRVPEWQARISAGWEVLETQHPAVAAEARAAIDVLLPLSPPEAGSASLTMADAFGCIALSLPADATTAALTITHELQHNKLAVLLDMVRLANPVPDENFYAPWRPDPRPLIGLLHGTYAHLSVAGFWRRQLGVEQSYDAQVEFVRWRNATQEAIATLRSSGRLTEHGTRFARHMAAALDAWRTDDLSATAVTGAKTVANAHREHWRALNTS